MSITAVIEYRGLAAHLITKRGFKRIFTKLVKEALVSAGLRWRKKYLPLHFKRVATARYGYSQRSPGHKQAKMKKYGHSLPLVFSGTSRDEILGDKQVPVVRRRRGRLGVLVRIKAPKYFYQYIKKSKTGKAAKIVDKLDEVTRITRAEHLDLAKHMDTDITTGLNKVGGRKRKKVA